MKTHKERVQSLTKPIKVLGTMKVIDISTNSINRFTWNFLHSEFITYRDEKLNEHLINIHDAIDQINDYGSLLGKNINIVKQELTELQALANKNDAAYIRFI